MTDILILQHESDTPPGSVELWASVRGLKSQVCRVDQAPLPAQESFRALVICGGGMDTFEEDLYPWLRTEKQFLKETIAAGKPIFGLCLGSQLLAEVLGGRSYPFKKWEIGFVPIQLLDGGETLHVFHWHQCTFDLPPGAKLLATNDFCPNQAYAWGDKIIATQFHPEAQESWIQECADDVGKKNYEGQVQNRTQMLESLPLQKTMQKWFFAQLDSWFARA